MKMAWETETGHLACRWSGAGEHVPYDPPWIQDASRSAQRKTTSPLPDFAMLSPFGGGLFLDRLRRGFCPR
jgi:hypothetical protein